MNLWQRSAALDKHGTSPGESRLGIRPPTAAQGREVNPLPTTTAAEILREAIERHMDAASVRDWTDSDRQLYEALEWASEAE